MYLTHFNLDKPPFQSKPDPDFLYLSEAHARAKTYLDYTVWNRDGLAVITGKIGAGKTTLINHLLARLPKDILAIKIHQTQLNEIEFLQTLLANLGIEAFDANKAKLLSLFNNVLKEQHSIKHKVLLIVDEAQHLSPQVLEEVRLLTGIEIEGEEIFNCILVGHAELMDTLNATGLEQLSQRVRLRFHIPGLSQSETLEYIDHRLTVAGQEQPLSIFPDSVVPLIYDYTGGIPRLINILCDAAMVAAYAEDRKTITTEIIQTAIDELQWKSPQDTARTTNHKALGYIDESKVFDSSKDAENTNDIDTSPKHLADSKNLPSLHISRQNITIKHCPLEKNCRITMGRYPNNDVVLEHELVSRHHALIASREDEFILDDLKSSNGTFANDQRIVRYVLQDGDIVKIGPYEITFSNPTLPISSKITRLITAHPNSTVANNS